MRLGELFEARAYHGSGREFTEFSDVHVGTGNGSTTFGWGIYFSRDRRVANHYKPRGGKVYIVDVPDDDEMLDWNLPLRSQSPIVQAALQKLGYENYRQAMIEKEYVGDYDYGPDIGADSGEDIYGVLVCAHMSPVFSSPEQHLADKKATSLSMLKAGLAGIRYHDVEVGRGLVNLCIFDPHRVKIEDVKSR